MDAKKIAEIKFFLDNINLRLNYIYTTRRASIFSRFMKYQKPAFVRDILAFLDFSKHQNTGFDIDFTWSKKSKIVF